MPSPSPLSVMSVRTRSIGSSSISLRRVVERVDRADDLIAGVGQQMLVVERDQRLVLDHQDPPDFSFTLVEQHLGPSRRRLVCVTSHSAVGSLAGPAKRPTAAVPEDILPNSRPPKPAPAQARAAADRQAARPRRNRLAPRDRADDRGAADRDRRRGGREAGDPADLAPWRHRRRQAGQGARAARACSATTSRSACSPPSATRRAGPPSTIGCRRACRG